ncbi:MAG: hypothetical protein KFW07_01355 [Mycoplasmataceae bacterium]|nr:hypothetical protein [Mycoplasmataceae bacterium]
MNNKDEEKIYDIIDFCNNKIFLFDSISKSKNPKKQATYDSFLVESSKEFFAKFSNNDFDLFLKNKNIPESERIIIANTINPIRQDYNFNCKTYGSCGIDYPNSKDLWTQLIYLINILKDKEEENRYFIDFEMQDVEYKININKTNDIKEFLGGLKKQMIVFQKDQDTKNLEALTKSHSKLKEEFKQFKDELTEKEVNDIKREIINELIALFPLVSKIKNLYNIFLIPSKIKKIKLIESNVNFE